jgi:hypothetical protein
MADPDAKPDSSIIGRDTDAAPHHADTDGDELAEQLNQTTSESAGGTVSGTEDDEGDTNLDIVFEPEEPENGGH